MSRKNKKYTKEFIQEAVKLALKSPSISGVAEELGIPVSSLNTWLRKLKKQGKLSTVNEESAKDMASLIEVNRRLQRELAIAREEKEILKKAMAFFKISRS